jgi:hypothetical protein
MWESKEAEELWQRVKQLPLSDRLELLVLLASSVQHTIERPKYEAQIVADAIAHGMDPKELLGLLNQDDYPPGENPRPEQITPRGRPR